LELAVSEKKTTIPILTTLRLEPSGSNLLVTSSDLDKYTVTNVTAMFDEAGAGAFLLPHRKTLELLKGETGIVRITPKITTHKNNFTYAWVNLHVGGCDYDLPTMDPSNFPETPKIPKGGIIVPAADFKAVLGRVMPAISTEESRYTLNGGLFDVAGNKLIVVTTDGHRLALDAIRLKGKNKDRKAVIAHEALTWLHKQAKGGDVKISLGTDKDLYSSFHVGNTTLISRNLTGQFPNYHAVLPPENEFTLIADFPSADELSKTLVKVARMANERSGAVKFTINGAVTLSAESSASGKASAPVKASINNSGKEITIGLNSAYVLDVLKVAGKNPVALSLKDAQSAGVFTVPSLPEYSYVLMPMRI
jgi:DNA polymerase-3 subunit beta